MLYGTLRSFIKETIAGVHYFGMKKASINDVEQNWPELFEYLQQEYGDFLTSCVVAIKKRSDLFKETPYVLLPNKSMSVISWDEDSKQPIYSQSEDLARAIERLK